jgi:hypothetical protein
MRVIEMVFQVGFVFDRVLPISPLPDASPLLAKARPITRLLAASQRMVKSRLITFHRRVLPAGVGCHAVSDGVSYLSHKELFRNIHAENQTHQFDVVFHL